MLYSRVQTLALIIAVVSTNFFQLLMFIGTSMELVRDGRGDAHMWLLGWFQSINSRSSGLQVFDLKRLAKVMMVVYGFFMWLNPFPIVMAMERESPYFEGHPIVSQFMKKYVTKHNSWIFIFYMIVATAEQDNLSMSGNWPAGDRPNTTLYGILFELLSAYGARGWNARMGAF
jgi:Trk-type K+ transport system membrane component